MSKKKSPKDRIPRSRVRPRQSKKARETYGKGFNSRGVPITCGYPTDWGGECGAYVADGGLCDIHLELDREKRKTETIEDRRRMWQEGAARTERSHARLKKKWEQEQAETNRKGRR
jgi:hypothetical protein